VLKAQDFMVAIRLAISQIATYPELATA